MIKFSAMCGSSGCMQANKNQHKTKTLEQLTFEIWGLVKLWVAENRDGQKKRIKHINYSSLEYSKTAILNQPDLQTTLADCT